GFVERHPGVALVLLVTVPQFLGSAVNILYNATHIIDGLAAGQKDAFVSLLAPYNAVFYPLGIAIAIGQLLFLARAYRHRSAMRRPSPGDMARIRQKLLRSPRVLILATTVGWLPGALLFPAL